MTLSAEGRAEIMKTRETHPRMRSAELKALATKHGVTFGYAVRLRALHAARKGLPREIGRAPVIDAHQERELLVLLLLQRQLTDVALAQRFGISVNTFSTRKTRLLCRPRNGVPQIDLDRLLQSIQGGC